MIASTPEPPYVAVIFTAQRTDIEVGYHETVVAMQLGAKQQRGYLGLESVTAPDGFEITVSYWQTEADAQAWKHVAEHMAAQARGRAEWYSAYEVRVAAVTRSYGFIDSGQVIP